MGEGVIEEKKVARMISVIVPIKNEAPEAAERFRVLSAHPDIELLVADAGGNPETTRAFQSLGARIIEGPGPRGERLARTAREARGEILLFFHSDSLPPHNAPEAAPTSPQQSPA